MRSLFFTFVIIAITILNLCPVSSHNIIASSKSQAESALSRECHAKEICVCNAATGKAFCRQECFEHNGNSCVGRCSIDYRISEHSCSCWSDNGEKDEKCRIRHSHQLSLDCTCDTDTCYPRVEHVCNRSLGQTTHNITWTLLNGNSCDGNYATVTPNSYFPVSTSCKCCEGKCNITGCNACVGTEPCIDSTTYVCNINNVTGAGTVSVGMTGPCVTPWGEPCCSGSNCTVSNLIGSNCTCASNVTTCHLSHNHVCPTNSSFVNGECQCDTGFNFVNGTCIARVHTGDNPTDILDDHEFRESEEEKHNFHRDDHVSIDDYGRDIVRGVEHIVDHVEDFVQHEAEHLGHEAEHLSHETEHLGHEAEHETEHLGHEAEHETEHLGHEAEHETEHLGHETKHETEHLGHETKHETEHLGHEAEHLGHETKHEAEHLGHETKHEAEHLGHETKHETEHLGHETKHETEHLGHETKHETEHLGHETKHETEHLSREAEHETEHLGHEAEHETEHLGHEAEHETEHLGHEAEHETEHLGHEAEHETEHLGHEAEHLGHEAVREVEHLGHEAVREVEHLGHEAVREVEHLGHEAVREVEHLGHEVEHESKHLGHEVEHVGRQEEHRSITPKEITRRQVDPNTESPKVYDYIRDNNTHQHNNPSTESPEEHVYVPVKVMRQLDILESEQNGDHESKHHGESLGKYAEDITEALEDIAHRVENIVESKQSDDDDQSPKRKQSDDDQSPKRKQSDDDDQSPKRKQSDDDDQSPKRKQSDDDQSPKRKQSDDDQSPKRKQSDTSESYFSWSGSSVKHHVGKAWENAPSFSGIVSKLAHDTRKIGNGIIDAPWFLGRKLGEGYNYIASFPIFQVDADEEFDEFDGDDDLDAKNCPDKRRERSDSTSTSKRSNKLHGEL
jgi:hypothetical protein